MNVVLRCTRLTLSIAFLLIALCGHILTAAPASAAGSVNESMEAEFAALVNQERTNRGLPALGVSISIRDVARTWSGTMAGGGRIWHNPNVASQIGNLDPAWRGLGENVGVGYSVSSLHKALMNSTGHRDNILGNWTYVTLGVVTTGDGRIWVTQNFIRTPTPHTTMAAAAASPPPVTESLWLARNSVSPGSPDLSVPYGMSNYRKVSCDWDGNGTDTVGVYTGNTFYLRNENTPGSPQMAISFGWSGVTPVCGDWNGDGIDTIGIYSNGQWYLRDSNTPGQPHHAFAFGWSAAGPVVGDWDGNGVDGIGVYAAGSWYLRQAPSAGGAQIATSFGYQGTTPVVGDWDGNGTSSIGVFDNGNWYLRQDTSPGRATITFAYGWPGTKPLAADWDGDQRSGVAVLPG